MTREEMIAKLRRLHTLLTIERRSNNLALALRRAMAFIESWKESPDQVSAKISTRRLFAGYGPKFLRIYDEIRESGTCELLEELQRRHSPFFCALCEIPSIGVGMARRMYYDRSICSPADLQIAYSNRILEKIPAFGEQRLKAVETWLVDPPKSHFEVADSGNRSAKAQIGEASDRGRRNAKIFQSSVFNAIGKGGAQSNAEPNAPYTPNTIVAQGGANAPNAAGGANAPNAAGGANAQNAASGANAQNALDAKKIDGDELSGNRDKLGGNDDELGGNDDELSGNRDKLGENRDELGENRDELWANEDKWGGDETDDAGQDDDLYALTDPNIDIESELRMIDDYRAWQAQKRHKAAVAGGRAMRAGRDASMGDLAAIDVAGRGRGDVAKDLQNQSICCSKFACTNLQANKILARCVFAHTIQCNKMIADSVTRVSKSQWEQRKQGYIAVDDAWDGVQSGNVMANQIDAETIQADDVVARRVYC
ncbi:MAG: hypothetical protein KIG72_04460, partial [Bradymonadales bacterium]|nr:hypothetical protein [Bradymonadales bacterium]